MTGKMTDLQVLETSGVDHPAHLHEGFAVMKANDPTTASAIMRALGKDKTMGTNPRTPSAQTSDRLAQLVKEAVAAGTKEVVKDVDSKLQGIQDELAKVWQDLQAYAQTTDDTTPSPEQPDPAAAAAVAAPPAAVAASVAELEKALGKDVDPGVRAMLVKQAETMAALQKAAEASDKRATEAFEKAAREENARLDADAIRKSEDTYGNLALDHATIAPVLRRMEKASPEMAATLTGLLTSLNEQQDGASLFKELGHNRRATSGAESVRKRAEELVASGQFDTIQKASAHIYETDPSAAIAARQEA